MTNIHRYIFQLELKHYFEQNKKKGLINLFFPFLFKEKKRRREKKTNEKEISLINLRLILSKINRQPTVPTDSSG